MENVMAVDDLEKLFSDYPNLYLAEETNEEFIISGSLRVNKIFNDFHVDKEYEVSLYIPKCLPQQLPYVYETSGKVSDSYSHKYTDQKLCLGTDIEIFIDFSDGMSITKWVNNYVISYFFSYEYFIRFCEYPFEERSHGISGPLEFYQEYFELTCLSDTLDFLKKIHNKSYRGHLSCPCNSGKKTRECHGEKLLRLYKLGVINRVFVDYDIVLQEVKKYNEFNTNRTK